MKRKMLCLSIITTMLLATACKKPVPEVTDPAVPEPEPQVISETSVDEPTDEELSPVDAFIKDAKKPERFSSDKYETALSYTDNEIFALFICSSYGEDADRWHELYDGMEVTVTYTVPSYNDYRLPMVGESAIGVSNWKEDATYGKNFSSVISDTLFYSLDHGLIGEDKAKTLLQTPLYITVKGRVEGDYWLKDAELISWAVDDEHRADFEACKLDACKEVHDQGRVVDYDYVWSKYTDHITTFEH